MDPMWRGYTAGIFTSLDPPTALQPAATLAPHVTPAGNARSYASRSKAKSNPRNIAG